MVLNDKHYYEIDLKQGDLFIQLISDDIYFISKQMQCWFEIFLDDSYKPVKIPPGLPFIKELPSPSPKKEEEAKTQSSSVQSELSTSSASLSSDEIRELFYQISRLQHQVEALTQKAAEPQISPEVSQAAQHLNEEEPPSQLLQDPPLTASVRLGFTSPTAAPLPPKGGEEALLAKRGEAELSVTAPVRGGELLLSSPNEDEILSFEQPVDKPEFSVEKPDNQESPESLETFSNQNYQEESTSFKQPVEKLSQLLTDERDQSPPPHL